MCVNGVGWKKVHGKAWVSWLEGEETGLGKKVFGHAMEGLDECLGRECDICVLGL